jgi:hypothetical protein
MTEPRAIDRACFLAALNEIAPMVRESLWERARSPDGVTDAGLVAWAAHWHLSGDGLRWFMEHARKDGLRLAREESPGRWSGGGWRGPQSRELCVQWNPDAESKTAFRERAQKLLARYIEEIERSRDVRRDRDIPAAARWEVLVSRVCLRTSYPALTAALSQRHGVNVTQPALRQCVASLAERIGVDRKEVRTRG